MKKQRHSKKQSQNRSERDANAKPNKTTRNRKKSKQRRPDESGGSGGGGDGSEMDDIVAQLRRQREKKQQQSKEASSSPAADTDQCKNTNLETTHDDIKKNTSIGDFQYDPVMKRYLPKSAYKPHGNNDVCIQRVQKERKVNKLHDAKEVLVNNDNLFQLRGNVTDGDIQRVVFRGTYLPRSSNIGDVASLQSKSGKNKRKKRCNNTNLQIHKKDFIQSQHQSMPCSDRTALLLKTSLEYCTNTARRNAITSLLGPMSIARRAEIVPTQSTLKVIQNGTKKYNNSYVDLEEYGYNEPTRPFAEPSQECQQSVGTALGKHGIWFSMLHPIKTPREMLL